jgi:hypothetical protein
MRQISRLEVAQHSTELDCWVVIDNMVLDVTAFLKKHPGGISAISKPGRGGCDVSLYFNKIGHSAYAKSLLMGMQIGVPMDNNCDNSQMFDVGMCDLVSRSNAVHDVVDQPQHDYASRWHATRRKNILKDHPQIALLMGSNPWTCLVGLVVVFVHAITCIIAQRPECPWYLTLFLAYTIGAVCKMHQFSVNHDIWYWL